MPLIRPVRSAKPTALLPSFCFGDADVVALVVLGRRGGGAVGQRLVQVLVLQHLAELLRAPVGHQELDAGAVALPAVAVVAEDRGAGRPDVGHLVGTDEDADPLAEHRVGRQPAADEEVVAGLAACVADADEGDVVDLGLGAVVDAARHRRLPLAREVAELRVADVLRDGRGDDVGGVEDLVLEDAGQRAAEHDARDVAAGLHATTAPRTPAAPRSPGRPRSGSSGTARSAGR